MYRSRRHLRANERSVNPVKTVLTNRSFWSETLTERFGGAASTLHPWGFPVVSSHRQTRAPPIGSSTAQSVAASLWFLWLQSSFASSTDKLP